MTEQELPKDEELIKNDGKDLQRITSWIGRVEANTKKQNEMFAELSQKLDTLSNKGPKFGEDDQAKFNEKLHTMILEGKVMEALKLVNNVNEEAKKRIKAADTKMLDEAIMGFADEPVMKNEDLAKEIRSLAESMVKNGHDPRTAVNLAKTQVENKALKTMLTSGQRGSLDLLSKSGGRQAHVEDKKLPPQAEAAFQRAMSKGLFKDRDEYLKYLDPRVREAWGV